MIKAVRFSACGENSSRPLRKKNSVSSEDFVVDEEKFHLGELILKIYYNNCFHFIS